jgi:hypothetical protein
MVLTKEELIARLRNEVRILLLEQLPEPCGRKARGTDNDAHRVRVHGIVTWNGDDPLPVCHDDVFALPDDSESGFLQRADGTQVGNSGDAHPLGLKHHFPPFAACG